MLRINLPFSLFFLLFCVSITVSFSQTVGAGLTSTPNDVAGTVSICIDESITFTGFTGSQENSFALYAIRPGETDPVLLLGRKDSPSFIITGGIASNTINDQDQVFVRIWNKSADDAGAADEIFSNSRTITVTVNSKPLPTLINDAINNTFCSGQPVTFSTLPNNNGANEYQYSFYVNNTLVQARSINSIYGPISTLSDGDLVRVEVFNSSSCMESNTLQMFENEVNDGGTIAFEDNVDGSDVINICSGVEPSKIISNSSGSNVLYSEEKKELDPDIPQGLEFDGWDGFNAPPSPNFIYRFEGETPNEPDPIIRTGTFILLR